MEFRFKYSNIFTKTAKKKLLRNNYFYEVSKYLGEHYLTRNPSGFGNCIICYDSSCKEIVIYNAEDFDNANMVFGNLVSILDNDKRAA